jgi:hypothetical protein
MINVIHINTSVALHAQRCVGRLQDVLGVAHILVFWLAPAGLMCLAVLCAGFLVRHSTAQSEHCQLVGFCDTICIVACTSTYVVCSARESAVEHGCWPPHCFSSLSGRGPLQRRAANRVKRCIVCACMCLACSVCPNGFNILLSPTACSPTSALLWVPTAM